MPLSITFIIMSKPSLKKHLQSLTKEQIIEVVLEAYGNSKAYLLISMDMIGNFNFMTIWQTNKAI